MVLCVGYHDNDTTFMYKNGKTQVFSLTNGPLCVTIASILVEQDFEGRNLP